jgi:hypothetical protein
MCLVVYQWSTLHVVREIKTARYLVVSRIPEIPSGIGVYNYGNAPPWGNLKSSDIARVWIILNQGFWTSWYL